MTEADAKRLAEVRQERISARNLNDSERNIDFVLRLLDEALAEMRGIIPVAQP